MKNVARTQIKHSSTHMPFGKILACVAIGIFMVMMLIKPDFYLNSARRGLSLYATSVLPSLFPFYFFSLLLTYIGSAKAISTVFQKPVKLLYNAPKESAYVLILSMLSGYPVGASMTAELYSAGVISQKEAKSIAAFASTSGPIFMLGTVGTAIFQDVRIGVVILVAHYIAALLNGLIFRVRDKQNIVLKRKSKRGEKKNQNAEILDGKSHNLPQKSIKASQINRESHDLPQKFMQTAQIMSNQDADNIMSQTIANSTLSMLYVGGYIVLCGMLVDTLSLLHVDTLILSALGERAGQPLIALLQGLIEMTRGSISCASCPTNLGIALCAGIISFGGLSVTLQNYTFLSKCKMSFFEIVLRKLCQSVIAFIIAFGLSYII